MNDDFEKFLKQATQIQDQMKQTHNKLEQQEVTGVAGGGLVKVVMNGRHDISNIEIDESLMNDREILEDMIAGAVNDAVRRVDEVNQKAIEKLTGGLPGLDMLR